MTNIGLMGDVHGDPSVIAYGLKLFKEQGVDTVVQVGDFGFWPGTLGQQFLNVVSKHLTDNNQYLVVIPGNHEDYNQIESFDADENGWQVARSRIRVAPRGYRWEWEGVSFVALGGAPSVDRMYRISQQRRNGYPIWWPAEAVTQDDVDVTVAGGYADVMLTHDAPFGVPQIEKKIGPNPYNFNPLDLEYAREGRVLMREAVEGVQPKLLVGGHYHFLVNDTLTLDSGNSVRVRIMNADGKYGTYAILDLTDLSLNLLG